jgi:hypothetical protein
MSVIVSNVGIVREWNLLHHRAELTVSVSRYARFPMACLATNPPYDRKYLLSQ